MILTITPNPALDISGEVDDIAPNEKNYVSQEQRHPGGNAINTARIIASLKVPVLATGFLGGAFGDELASLLDQEQVPHQFVRIAQSTRVNVTVSNCKTHQQTRLSFPGPTIHPDEVECLYKTVDAQVEAKLLNIGGSFPPGFTIDHIRKLLHIGANKGKGAVVDVPSKHLKEIIAMQPILVKPNLTEFRELVGHPVATRDEVLNEARKLTQRVPFICVSSVEGGVVLVTARSAWFAKGPQVKVKSSVGAGDAMVGAILTELYKARIFNNESARNVSDEIIDSMLRSGLSAALATIITPGTILGDAEGIKEFLPRIEVKKIPYSPS